MTDLQPVKYQSSLFAATAGILLLPFILLAFFNVPSSDDFLYAKFQRESGTIDANVGCYFGWGGRYFSNLLLTTCNPLSYSTEYKDFLIPYQLHSIVLLVFMVVSFTFLLQRILGAGKSLFSFGLLVIGMLFFFLKDFTELLYWMAGSYTYCYGLSFCLMAFFYITPSHGTDNAFALKKSWLALIIGLVLIVLAGFLAYRFKVELKEFLNPKPELFVGLIGLVSLVCLLFPLVQSDQKRTPLVNFSLVLVCSFLAIGSNEIYAFLLVPFFGLVSLHASWRRKKILWEYFLLTLAATGMAALNLFAPSTFARRNLQTRNLHSFSIFDPEQLGSLLSYFGYFFTFSLLLFSLYLFWKNEKPIKEANTGPSEISFLPAGFGILSVIYLLVVVPVVLSILSGPIPDRAKNPLAIVATFPLLLLFRFIAGKFPSIRKVRWAILVAGLLGTAFLQQALHLSQGWLDISRFIVSGNASRSIGIHKERFHTISTCTSDVCFIRKNPFQPQGFLGGESAILDEDPLSWKNYKRFSFAEYYQKKSIIAR